MKRIICLFLVCIFSLGISVPAFASNTINDEYQIISSSPDENSRAEETMWVIRRHDGIVERRLWSITYGYWLTDWEIIGYYDP